MLVQIPQRRNHTSCDQGSRLLQFGYMTVMDNRNKVRQKNKAKSGFDVANSDVQKVWPLPIHFFCCFFFTKIHLTNYLFFNYVEFLIIYTIRSQKLCEFTRNFSTFDVPLTRFYRFLKSITNFFLSRSHSNIFSCFMFKKIKSNQKDDQSFFAFLNFKQG